jgi:hypothetical protein
VAAGVDETAHAGAIANLKVFYFGPDRAHDPRNLVARHDGIVGFAPVAANRVNVGMANTAIFYVDDDVVLRRVSARERKWPKRLFCGKSGNPLSWYHI